MERPVYRARRELFERMDIPVTKADIQILKWKQCVDLTSKTIGVFDLLGVDR